MHDGWVIPNRCSLFLGAALLVGQVALAPAAAAQPFFPFQQLVDAAAQRLATADPVAAAKWINGGPITDKARADQVLDSVAADATAHGIDPQYVREVFADQIAANEGVQYTRFGQWKFDPGTAPSTRTGPGRITHADKRFEQDAGGRDCPALEFTAQPRLQSRICRTRRRPSLRRADSIRCISRR